MRGPSAQGRIVVGVDGSKAAVQAALWAVDEAVSREVPLRLVCAIEPAEKPDDQEQAAKRLAAAETAARHVAMAVDASDKTVKIEVEIDQDRPVAVLLKASRSAAMVCIGAVGLHHYQPGRLGSTAAAVATSARCPVAIIRDGGLAGPDPGCIIVEADNSPHTGVLLETAMEEARLRSAPLRVLACWRTHGGEIRGTQELADANRQVRAELDRRLAHWRRSCPDLDVQAVAVHGSLVDYLTDNAGKVQLVVVGSRDHLTVQQLLAPTGNAVLRRLGCSLLIADRQHL